MSYGHWTDTGNLFRVLADIEIERGSTRPRHPTGLVDALPAPAVELDRLSFLYGVVPIGPEPMPGQVLAVAGAHVAWLAWLDPATGRPRS